MPDDALKIITPNDLFGAGELKRRTNKCDMSIWRWVKTGYFPPPDFWIKGQRYWKEITYAEWLESQKTTNVRASEIPNFEEGRAKGLEKIAAINAAKKDPHTPTDQLGHSGGPPLDHAAQHSDHRTNKVGESVEDTHNG